MPVDRASYRPWEGTVRPSRRVTLAIAGTMIRRSMKQRLVRYLVRIVVLGVCLVSGFWFYLANSGVVAELRQFMAIPGLDPLAAVNRLILMWTGGFALLMAAVVGTPLIAEDHKARALPLYFSRPITHLDYVLGKFLTVFWFLALLFLLPPVFMYVIELGFSDEAGLALKQLPMLGKSLVPGLVGCMVYASLALGASSLTAKTNQAALLYFGIVMMAFVMSNVLKHAAAGGAAWEAVSPGNCIQRIGAELMPLPAKAGMGDPGILNIPLAAAWTGAGAWTVAGLGILVVRIRNVEVVS
jgi:ABC-type transport system involved in multi-copper enzyme maturation permease subunit